MYVRDVEGERNCDWWKCIYFNKGITLNLCSFLFCWWSLYMFMWIPFSRTPLFDLRLSQKVLYSYILIWTHCDGWRLLHKSNDKSIKLNLVKSLFMNSFYSFYIHKYFHSIILIYVIYISITIGIKWILMD